LRPVGAAATASHRVTVGEADLAAFADGVVHRVYGTAAMVRDMEYAARLVLLPLLEPGEEGVGAEVWCRHLAPVPVGGSVELSATATEQTRNRLVCRTEARHHGRLVGEGTVTQVIIDPARFAGTDPAAARTSDEGAP
jgi:fluoroacetyl-CoA thioesterase